MEQSERRTQEMQFELGTDLHGLSCIQTKCCLDASGVTKDKQADLVPRAWVWIFGSVVTFLFFFLTPSVIHPSSPGL